MVEGMKFEESSLTGYLVKNLEPLTEANPVYLAKYVVALLKKDRPLKELQKLCTDSLVEFLGNGAPSFTAKLFQALEDGSIVKLDMTLDAIQKSEPSQAPITEGIHPFKNSSPKEGNLSTSSESSSDTDDKEVSDNDDDDRNHKHRKREAQTNSLESDIQEQFIRRPNRKRNKPYDNGQEERHTSSKFNNCHSEFTPIRPPLDLGPHARFNQTLRNDLAQRFDLSSSLNRPIGRGRGRSTVPWSQHDSRFNLHDTLDFASQMASQGPTHPNLFVGTGLPNAASGFGFIPGMPNGIMDPLNPLVLQGALRPTISPPLNLGMPRQRCRDFEERGFCLRGDMCPMEHGLNRIVVEDVQSLSQFNLPVSIPIQAVSAALPLGPVTSGQLANTKSISSKRSKSGVMVDALNISDIPSTSGAGDADVYDPDQPLWNNERLPSPNIEDGSSLNGDSSVRIGSEIPSRKVTGNIGSMNTSSSVWGRISSGNKSDPGGKIRNVGNVLKENHEEAIKNTRAFNQSKGSANMEIDSKATTTQPFARSHADPAHINGRAFPKALRTLYVNAIPQKSNRRDALISHFKKFGEVIDIYIPLNSEKAFVQFSKREEAEAALNSPDAVMGNRFIKLSWANRDRIPDDGQSSGHNAIAQSNSLAPASVPFKQSAANGGKGTVPISAQKSSSIPPVEAPIAPVKGLMSNAPKAAPPAQKKFQSAELLEEIRRKQESLAKKREEFRRQLEKIEKQAIPIKKGDMGPEQTVKRHKVDAGGASEKTATPSNLGQVAEKILEKISEGVLIPNGSKANFNVLQQSSKNMYQTSPLPTTIVNRYKLDNRSTSFRILHPLPAGFASVAVIKDHFSRHGVISSVMLEDPGHIENESLNPCEKCSACITFSTRHSAEKAYQTSKYWNGHSLQFKWLTVSKNNSGDCGEQEISSGSSPKIAQIAGIPLNIVTSESSSSAAEKLSCSVISEVEPNHEIEASDCSLISLPKSPVFNSQCRPLDSPDALMIEDGNEH